MSRARGSDASGLQAGGSITAASLILAAGLFGSGCSSSPTLQSAGPSYLGVAEVHTERAAESAAMEPRVSSGKVLSAIVFERVTGVPVDPASLLDR